MTIDAPAAAGSTMPRVAAVLGGFSGVLLLIAEASPRYYSGAPPLLAGGLGLFDIRGTGWAQAGTVVVATALALCLLRFWPYLLAAAGLLYLPQLLTELKPNQLHFPTAVHVLSQAHNPLLIIGLLACAQGLLRSGSIGWGAAVAGLGLGGRVVGTAILGPGWLSSPESLTGLHVVLLVVWPIVLAPAIWWFRRGDEPATGPRDGKRWPWLRFVLTGVAASALVVPLSFLTSDRLATLLGVTQSALYRHGYAVAAVIGAIMAAAALILAAVAGLWSLGGALTAAVAQIALVAPMLLAITAMSITQPARWFAAIVGVALGALVAASRWRTPLAVTLTVAGAMAMFIAYAATTGHPEKLADQRQVIPAALLMIVIAAAVTAVVGCTAPVLAPRGALPAVAGPIVAVLAAGGLQVVEVTYLQQNGLPESSYLNPVLHLNTSAVLLLVAGAATGGLGLAQQLANRRAERKRTEQIQREAAAAERDRLARPIHDGVLQVLALVQRHGSEMGGPGPQLAELAGEQEAALRNLLSGQTPSRLGAPTDLRTSLLTLASPSIDVAAPAEPVVLPAAAATELTAAIQAALDNVRRHAGASAHVWILLEDEGNAVRVTVRDNGVGFAPGRLTEAADSGRLGVAQSMRGRVTDLGGTMTIFSRPGDGTEVEFQVPRR